MAVIDYFKPVEVKSAEEVRGLIKNKKSEDYNIVDVRQPKEYERGHIPGAILIPLNVIRERIDELDKNKPTITYCGSGVRSRAAAATLRDRGFQEIYSMTGGIGAWEGIKASGVPESGMAHFTSASGTEELIALAWILEDGLEKFYTAVPGIIKDADAQKLFKNLINAEVQHKNTLFNLYRDVTGKEPPDDFPISIVPTDTPGDIMEGGMRVSEALEYIKDKKVAAVLELAVSLEANAYDLYMKMKRHVEDDKSKHVFEVLSGEEKSHLQRLTVMLEQKI